MGSKEVLLNAYGLETLWLIGNNTSILESNGNEQSASVCVAGFRNMFKVARALLYSKTVHTHKII
jgi:hypothetical protein